MTQWATISVRCIIADVNYLGVIFLHENKKKTRPNDKKFERIARYGKFFAVIQHLPAGTRTRVRFALVYGSYVYFSEMREQKKSIREHPSLYVGIIVLVYCEYRKR